MNPQPLRTFAAGLRRRSHKESMAISTISDAYRAEQRRLHENPRYGVASLGYAPLVEALLRLGSCGTLSDYGAGKCNLRTALEPGLDTIEYLPYDPAFPEYGPPRQADLVVCIDVLEHVEPELLDACLDELASITHRLALFTVHTGPARKTLSDGRNAHLTQEPASWWLPRLALRFDLLHVQHVRKGFFVIACPKGMYEAIEGNIDLRSIFRVAASCDPRPNILNPKHIAGTAKRDAGALWFAMRDPRTPWYVRLIAGSVSASALSPIDLTPDVIPVLGYMDDFILLIFGTLMAVRLIPRPLMDELRTRAATMQHETAAGGAMAILTLWFVAATILALRLWYPAL